MLCLCVYSTSIQRIIVVSVICLHSLFLIMSHVILEPANHGLNKRNVLELKSRENQKYHVCRAATQRDLVDVLDINRN